jgi:hypothetical protein
VDPDAPPLNKDNIVKINKTKSDNSNNFNKLDPNYYITGFVDGEGLLAEAMGGGGTHEIKSLALVI